MHIIVEQDSYDPRIIQAHATLEQALSAADALLKGVVDPWDRPGAERRIDHARDIGPATRAVAMWDIYDRTTYVIYEVVLTA
jgi:hypothetical protein